MQQLIRSWKKINDIADIEANNTELNIEKDFFKKYKLCYKSYKIANNDASWQSLKLTKRQTNWVYLDDSFQIELTEMVLLSSCERLNMDTSSPNKLASAHTFNRGKLIEKTRKQTYSRWPY